MTEQLVLVSKGALDQIFDRLGTIENNLAGATIIPAPEWVSIQKAADFAGVSKDTIRRRIVDGSMEARGTGKLRQVKVDQPNLRATLSASSS